jgi:hypothetical protein
VPLDTSSEMICCDFPDAAGRLAWPSRVDPGAVRVTRSGHSAANWLCKVAMGSPWCRCEPENDTDTVAGVSVRGLQ